MTSPIYGATTLPYQNLAAAQRLPVEEPDLTPAYVSGSTAVLDADRQAGPTAPISEAIVSKARELNWNPATIYDYVYNYVEVEWYHGCMKGAEETLNQGSGNDCDQAALLVSLLRASGYPARFVVGVGRFLDWERAPTLLGVSDVAQVPTLLRRAGIPYVEERAGGKLANIRFEHVWVEAYVPYTNYRGSVADEGGELWLPLDVSIKAAGHVLSQPPELPEGLDLATVADNYLQADRPETPLEFLKTEIEVALDAVGSELAYEDLQQSCTLKSQHLDILPAGLPFAPVLVTGESASVPERLLHRVSLKVFDALDPNRVFCELDLPAFKLSNRSIAVRYEPETVEDQEIINSYGGLGQTPAYLVRLRPVITVDGERLAVGSEGLPMGADARLSVELISPANQKSFVNELVVGNLTVMALVSGKPVLGETQALQNKGAEEIYFDEGLRYLARWQAAERELASLLRLKLLHPAPQVVTLGGVVQVTRLLGSPQEFTWKGAFVDADLRQVELVGAPINRYRFMELSGLQGSVLEDRVLREDLGIDSISTARFLALANNQGIPLVTVNATNVDTLLPGLPFGAKVKNDIRDAVQQGQEVLVTEGLMTLDAWTGVGYLRRDPLTGEAGWMLSGSIAGAYTVISLDAWPEALAAILENSTLGPPNYDENKARSISKLLAWDNQAAIVGTDVDLKVKVLDAQGQAVKDAMVKFEVLAGGGSLGGASNANAATDASGVATIALTLGTKTGDNPTYLNKEGLKYTTQAGLNVVDAYLINTGTHLNSPFSAFGLPDDGHASLKNLSGDSLTGRVMSYAGCVHLMLQDQYGNPISNKEITVDALAPIAEDPEDIWDPRPAWVIQTDDPCASSYPSFDEVPLSCTLSPGNHQQILSALNGAGFCITLGGSPWAIYPFLVSAGGENNLTINVEAYYSILMGTAGLCNLEEHVGSPCLAKVGGTATLPVLQEFVVRDRENQGEMGQFCDNQITCPVLTALPSFSVTSAVESRVIQASMLEEPFYQAQVELQEQGQALLHLQMPDQPGVYHYDWSSSASVSVPNLSGSCEGCSSENLDCRVQFYDQASGMVPEHELITCTAVQLEFQDLPLAFHLDEYGYTTTDNEIAFSILPVEYEPELALVDIFVMNGAREELVFSLPASMGQNWTTIGKGTLFDRNRDYFARLVINPGLSTEIASEDAPINLYSVKLDLQAYRPGTTAEPGEPVTEYEEDDPEQLVMFVNSNEDPDTHEREFLDDVIGPTDKDIVKLMLKQVSPEDAQAGRVEFTLRPQELFKIYDSDLQPLVAADLLDLTSSTNPNLDIAAGDVTLYFESLGPVYGAEARLSVVDRIGGLSGRDDLVLSSVFHREDYLKAVAQYAEIASSCDVNHMESCKSIWDFAPPGYLSKAVDNSRFWGWNSIDHYLESGEIKVWKFMALKPKVSAWDAIVDIFQTPQDYGFECNNAIRVIHQRAVIDLFDKCSMVDMYRCRYTFDGLTNSDAYDLIFESSVVAFASEYIDDIRQENYTDLKYTYDDPNYYTMGSWMYLINPSKVLRREGSAHQGVNLIYLDRDPCQMCDEGLARFTVDGHEYCPYKPRYFSDGKMNSPRCMKDKLFYGHDPGRKSMQGWVDEHVDYNTANGIVLDLPGEQGIRLTTRNVDFIGIVRKSFLFNRGER